MSNYNEEYSSQTVGCGGCYQSLSTYNQQNPGTQPPVSSKTVVGHYIVPAYGAISYDALTHGRSQPSCSGYFNITRAYGRDAAACNQRYLQRLCQ